MTFVQASSTSYDPLAAAIEQVRSTTLGPDTYTSFPNDKNTRSTTDNLYGIPTFKIIPHSTFTAPEPISVFTLNSTTTTLPPTTTQHIHSNV